VIRPIFHAWERRLASVDTNRHVRPFEWGLDWIDLDPAAPDPRAAALAWARQTTAASDRFFSAPPLEAGGFERRGDELRFPSAIVTPSDPNNTVVVRVIEARKRRADQPRRAVVVLPQWNSDADGHVGLGQLFARFGVTALRLSLPYHDVRRPPELKRADYIVSSNVGRTLQANRQAVLDVRRAVDWLTLQGYERIGIIGTSLGSCLAMLAMAHDPRIRAGAFNHVSPYFADVVWRGLSTAHVRAGLEQDVTLEELRQLWMPISPWPFIDRVAGRKALLVTARYDLTFPVDLSRLFVREFRRRRIAHQHVMLPCGHYTTGKTPFKFYDGYVLTRFFVKNL
jgi:hypothetical protein